MDDAIKAVKELSELKNYKVDTKRIETPTTTTITFSALGDTVKIRTWNPVWISKVLSCKDFSLKQAWVYEKRKIIKGIEGNLPKDALELDVKVEE